jgi:hypothetical protein
MATIFTNLLIDATSKKMARKYKVKPDSLVSITIEPDTIVIDYVEFYEDDQIGYCQKKIYRNAS